MGAGLAKGLRDLYPKMYDEYRINCARMGTAALVGNVQFYFHADDFYSHVDLYILGIYSQKEISRTKPVANPNWVHSGLIKTAQFLRGERFSQKPEIFMPKIGCNLGGLDWVESGMRSIVETFDDELNGEFKINICDYDHGKY